MLMATGAADLVSAFHIELKNNVQIPKKSMLELKNYKTNVSIEQNVPGSLPLLPLASVS